MRLRVRVGAREDNKENFIISVRVGEDNGEKNLSPPTHTLIVIFLYYIPLSHTLIINLITLPSPIPTLTLIIN